VTLEVTEKVIYYIIQMQNSYFSARKLMSFYNVNKTIDKFDQKEIAYKMLKNHLTLSKPKTIRFNHNHPSSRKSLINVKKFKPLMRLINLVETRKQFITFFHSKRKSN
jgi:hypothetical protein